MYKYLIESEYFLIVRIAMSKIMQNLVVLMDPHENALFNSLKAGNRILNRFCIDEDAAFELSGVFYLKNIKYQKTIYINYGDKKGRE